MKTSSLRLRLRNAERVFVALSVAWMFFAFRASAGLLGANINADARLMVGDYTFANALFTRPLFNQPGNNPTAVWDNMMEQYESSQLDFVALWLKGAGQPEGQPAVFQAIVAAINKRGLTDRLKLMPFDDNPASWCAQWNFDNGRGFGYAQPFDLSNSNLWATYIWNHGWPVKVLIIVC